jgi:excisionase family DNA binding protein
MQTGKTPPLAFSIPDAVAYSGLSRSRIYALMRDGLLPSVQVGGRRLITRAAIDSFFSKLSEAA